MKAEIKEAINRAEITKIFLEQGWMVYKPEADIDGVDFLIMNLKDENWEVRKIQLKSRWTVDKKYLNKRIWICFPDQGKWYLCEHDKMGEIGQQCNLSLWERENGEPRPNYSTSGMSKEMRELMAQYQFPIALKAAS